MPLLDPIGGRICKKSTYQGFLNWHNQSKNINFIPFFDVYEHAKNQQDPFVNSGDTNINEYFSVGQRYHNHKRSLFVLNAFVLITY